MIKAETREKIKDQALQEIAFDRTYKQGKIKNFQKNEEMYYSKKSASTESRANVELARMQEFVHTLLSKIDNPLVFKFIKRKEAQLSRANRLNALRQYDSQIDFWDIKDLVGKKQGIIYGRTVYAYSADSANGYQAHLENIDVYDFLVDPSGGGIDLERANHLGRYNVIKSKKELEDGVKDGIYIKTTVDALISGGGNSTDTAQEETNKRVRMYGQGTIGDKEFQTSEKYKFWEWFTTYDGERYYLLMTNSGDVVRIEKLTDMFSATKQFPLGAWPFWTWAVFPDLTEFWTPSYCDYVREMFMAQNASINQMLDNAEAINKPQRVVNVNALQNLAELKYRRDGIIKTKRDIDADKVIQLLRPPSISTPIDVFNVLEGIQEKALGITSGAKGVADEQGKVGIYEGNQEAAADRFGLLNRSYSFGYGRFAKLYEIGVRDNLVKSVAIDIMGPDGIETEEINRSDIFHKSDEFGVLVEASDAETMSSIQTQRMKITFLQGEGVNQLMNQKKALEMKAQIAGFNEDEIKELLDVSEFGDSKIMSECARDIESILEGKKIEPNFNANIAYKQKMVDYLKDHKEDMSADQFVSMVAYIEMLEPIVIKNTVRSLNAFEVEQAGKLAGERPTAGGQSAGTINNPTNQNEKRDFQI